MFYEAKKGDKDGEVDFCVMGGQGGKYRLSAYVGHKLMKFKNGASYIDIFIDSRHMYEGEIETEAVTGNEYDTLYFILVPINRFASSMVEKSDSMCLYQGGLWNDTNQ